MVKRTSKVGFAAICVALFVGSAVAHASYDYVGDYSEGLAPANVGGCACAHCWAGGKWGYVDSDTALVIGLQFDAAESFSEGLAWVRVGTATGYIDRTGQMTIALARGEHGYPFSEGMARLVRNDTWVYVDRTGAVVLRTNIDGEHTARDFHDGLAAVCIGGKRDGDYGPFLGGKWGYIDSSGRFAIAPTFDWAEDFEAGVARVNVGCEHAPLAGDITSVGGKWGSIDVHGQWVAPLR